MICKDFNISTVAVYDSNEQFLNKSRFPMIFDYVTTVGVEIVIFLGCDDVLFDE